MSLEEKIMSALKDAMKAKNTIRLDAIRAIKSELLLAKTSDTGAVISDELEIKVLQKLVKQRKESALIYQNQSRPDLAENEIKQAEIIEEFLPKQLSDEELESVLKEIMKNSGATSVKDMGKVMGLANQELKGKADGKRISDFVKKLLS